MDPLASLEENIKTPSELRPFVAISMATRINSEFIAPRLNTGQEKISSRFPVGEFITKKELAESALKVLKEAYDAKEWNFVYNIIDDPYPTRDTDPSRFWVEIKLSPNLSPLTGPHKRYDTIR